MSTSRSRPAGSRKARYSLDPPILLVGGFNLLTLVVFMTAPVRWDTPNLTSLCLLVLFCQVLILIGFQRGRRKGLTMRPRKTLPLFSGDSVMTYLLAIYALTFSTGYAFRMGFSPFDIAGMADLLAKGIEDRHFGYEMALRGTGLGPVPWTVYFMISTVNQCFFIAGFVYWKRMSPFAKVLFSVFVGIELLFTLGRGASFGIVILVTTFFLASMFWMKGKFSTALLLVALFAGSVALFSYNLYRRSGGVERTIEVSEFGVSTTIVDHPVFSLVPDFLHPTYLNVVSYLGGGYYHASLAMDLDFKSTWFLGNNPALIGLASLAGFDVWKDTYMHRLQVDKGVDELGNWHSAYTWFASDVSFYGVPLVLFGIAYLFGFSWSRSLKGDFLSRIVFVILGNMLLFLFANNTYLSVMFYSFMFLLPFWILTRFFSLAPAASLRRSAGSALRPQTNGGAEASR